MRTLGRCVALTAAVGLGLGLPAAAAWGAEAEGCTVSVTSRDANGGKLDTASAPGDGGTKADPFVVDPDGSVKWEGSSDNVIKDASWSVSVAGIQVRSGKFDNDEETKKADGVQSMDILPSAVAGIMLTGDQVIPVSGKVDGKGGSCTASGYITGTGSPTSSPMFYAGLVSAALGLAAGAGMVAGTKALAAAPFGGVG